MAEASHARPLSVLVDFATAPSDCLELIFSFIEVRPRLRCVSLVCKRWRSSVLRSVRSLSTMTHNFANIFDRFPSLTELVAVYGKDAEPVNLPSCLRSLAITLPQRAPRTAEVAIGDPLPALSHLRLRFHRELYLWTRLLQASLTSLVSLNLTIEDYFDDHSFLEQLLVVSHFPSLTSLSVSHTRLAFNLKSTTTALAYFVSAHSAHLISLELHVPDGPLNFTDIMQPNSYPVLRELKLSVPQERLERLLSTRLMAPALTSLSLLNADDLSGVATSLLTCLTEITVPRLQRADYLDTIPSLKKIWAHEFHSKFFSKEHSSTLSSRLMQLTVKYCGLNNALNTLQSFANIRRLRLHEYITASPTPLRLPFLTKLIMTYTHTSDMVLSCRLVLEGAPLLERVTLEDFNDGSRITALPIKTLCAFAEELLQRNVRKISFVMPAIDEELTKWAKERCRFGWIRVKVKRNPLG